MADEIPFPSESNALMQPSIMEDDIEGDVLAALIKDADRLSSPAVVYIIVEEDGEFDSHYTELIQVFYDKENAEKEIDRMGKRWDARNVLAKEVTRVREKWLEDHPKPPTSAASENLALYQEILIGWTHAMEAYLVQYLWEEFKPEIDRWGLDIHTLVNAWGPKEKPTWLIKSYKVQDH